MSLSREEYENRKAFLETLKTLSKSEKEQVFRIIKTHDAEYSDNSNGVFFDVASLPVEVFAKLNEFMDFCKEKKREQEIRQKEMENLRGETLQNDEDEASTSE
jgi:hypothetical protein